MRITSSYIYSQNIMNYQRQQNAIDAANGKLSSGLLINNTYDNAGMYSEGARLVYEIATFTQVSEAASKAVNITKNSDRALQDMSKSLEQFKNKLLQSANEIHSSTSLNAIANDLQIIRDHIVNLANTSINGQFLFSGTNIGTKPFDKDGTYNGNSDSMKVVLGSNVHSPYNIPGSELMMGVDNDYKKVVSTNVRLVDRRYDINKPDEIHYITKDNKIRDLIGKNYLDKDAKPELTVVDHFQEHDGARFPDTYFYIRGTKGDGESFKAKFKMEAKENVSALLNKIGELYGNTKENQLVKVELTNSGTIEITDLANNESKLNFSMFAATSKAVDFQQIYPPEPPTQAEIDAVNDAIAHNQQVTDAANAAGIPVNPDDLRPVPQLPVAPLPVNEKLASVVNPADLRDNDRVYVLEFTNTGDKDFTDVNDGIDYTRTLFDKKDNVLTSNIMQLDKNKKVATEDTKLVDASLAPINLDPANGEPSVLQIELTSRANRHYTIEFDITNGTVNAQYIDELGVDQTVEFPITDVHYSDVDLSSTSIKTDSKNITFRQLNDVIGMFANDNIPTRDYVLQADNTLTQADHDELQDLLKKSQNIIDVDLDDRGRIRLVDKVSTTTNIELAVFDRNTMTDTEFDFGVDANGDPIDTGVKSGDIFNFKTNSSLIVDESRLDIIKDLDQMIEAVRKGQYRPDTEDKGLLKNVGIQGYIKRIDHIKDHVSKIITKIGATQSNIENAQDRADVMIVNIKQVMSDVIRSDGKKQAEVMLELMQSMNVFQATLQASMQVSKLSLLNYM